MISYKKHKIDISRLEADYKNGQGVEYFLSSIEKPNGRYMSDKELGTDYQHSVKRKGDILAFAKKIINGKS